MNLAEFIEPGWVGLAVVGLFFGLMIYFSLRQRGQPPRPARAVGLREIPAFVKLGRTVGLAVEAGQRVHVSLGSGGLIGLAAAPALVGLSMLRRIARTASISDRPPIASSGEGQMAILSQDTLHHGYRLARAEHQYSPDAGQLSGLTPFSYTAGTLPVIYDQQVSANILVGSFGSEVALLAEAGERTGSLTLAGSESLPAQAVLYASAQEPLVGEEVYAGGAYIQAGPMHVASLRAQDVFRWVLVAIILGGALLKLAGVL